MSDAITRYEQEVRVTKELLKTELLRAKMHLDQLILVTPTSDRRNDLTEANIHVMNAITCVSKGS